MSVVVCVVCAVLMVFGVTELVRVVSLLVAQAGDGPALLHRGGAKGPPGLRGRGAGPWPSGCAGWTWPGPAAFCAWTGRGTRSWRRSAGFWPCNTRT